MSDINNQPETADAWYAAGNDKVNLGDINGAGECYRRALALQPDHCEANLNLGNVYFSQGKQEQAAIQYQKAIQSNPNHAVARCNLGNVYYSMGRYDEAANSYQTAIQLDPNLLMGYFNFGNLCMLREQYDMAVKNYLRAILLNPPTAQINAIKEKALLMVRINRLAEAKELFTQLCNSYPGDVAAWNNLSKINGRLGYMEEANECCRRVLALQPDHAEAHLILGNILFHYRKPEEALQCYEKALQLNPQSIAALNNFGKACQAVDQVDKYFEYYRKAVTTLPDPTGARIVFGEIVKNILPSRYEPWLDKELHASFLSGGVDENSLSRITTHQLMLKYRIQAADTIDEEGIQSLVDKIASDELFVTFLEKAINFDRDLEMLLGRLRRFLLIKYCEGKDLTDNEFRVITVLARQGLNNEYIIARDTDEERRVRELKDSIDNLCPTLSLPNKLLEDKILVFAMYDRLTSLACREHLNGIPRAAWSDRLQPLLEQALWNPFEEATIKQELTTIGEVVDETSRLVQSQYEENPYPRWLSVPDKRSGTIKAALAQLFPDFTFPAILDGQVRILVAGCGTGRHPIQIASHDNVEILAVDISRSSLAYASRMARKYGVTNIKFMQGDILQLAALEQRFHIIECVGVLHHMEDPLAGWKILTDLLVKDGLMSIGLYSELARKSIVAARESISGEHITPSTNNIRDFRRRVLASEPGDILYDLGNLQDFYSTSACRDLLFHFKEHRFTLPQINRILDDLKLNFIGFKFDSFKIGNAYRNAFPQDREMKNLLLWHEFETMHPSTFIKMYNFWCQKT